MQRKQRMEHSPVRHYSSAEYWWLAGRRAVKRDFTPTYDEPLRLVSRLSALSSRPDDYLPPIDHDGTAYGRESTVHEQPPSSHDLDCDCCPKPDGREQVEFPNGMRYEERGARSERCVARRPLRIDSQLSALSPQQIRQQYSAVEINEMIRCRQDAQRYRNYRAWAICISAATVIVGGAMLAAWLIR